ncbi:MAG: hypothetical protein RIS35_3004 [Pseudomonadota bacterium]|jgi:pyridoxal phosphate enzyme (YggS family)
MNEDTQLISRHAELLARIAAASAQAGRPADAVRLLAVSKTFPAEDVLALAGNGQVGFGENYLQEALDKMSRCEALRPDLAIEWHFIGPIQSNKTRPIAERFAWVLSVDRERIARRLSEQRPETLPALNVCIQVNVSGEATKSGCAPEEALPLARAISALPRLKLRGLMAIPEPTDDPGLQRRQCARLREVFERIRGEGLDLDTLSIGMSDDLEAAIAEGSTMVRIGTALFGSRPRRQD